MTGTNVLSDRYAEEESHLDAALTFERDRLEKMANTVSPMAVVQGRVKARQSMLRKAYRRGSTPRAWDDFGDLIALKVLLPTTEQANQLASSLKADAEENERLRQYENRAPKPDELAYSAHQFDLTSECRDSHGVAIKYEVQVRTVASDAWYVVDHQMRYKGAVDLDEGLQRRVLRLTVLMELFDSEVTSLAQDIALVADEQRTAVFDHARSLWNDVTGVHTPPVKPEHLFPALIKLYDDKLTADEIIARLDELVTTHRESLDKIARSHVPGAPRYSEARDWLFSEPEALIIADLARNMPRRVVKATESDDYAKPVRMMVELFKEKIPQRAHKTSPS